MEHVFNKTLLNTSFSCLKVSWNDNQRYSGQNGISCKGKNITDTRLITKPQILNQTSELRFPVTCRIGHVLECRPHGPLYFNSDVTVGYGKRRNHCNGCNSTILTDMLHRCEVCDYDLCSDCAFTKYMNKRRQMITDNGDGVLYTIRSDNWNETIGCVNAAEVILQTQAVANVRLDEYLKSINMFSYQRDHLVSIRFQTCFIPTYDSDIDGTAFIPESYNYQTLTLENPKNMLLLCTTQGVFERTDRPGFQKLFVTDMEGSEKWLSCTGTRFGVGGEQNETTEEKDRNKRQNKASALPIGIQEMGQRLNVLMVIQIPLKQFEVSHYSVKKPKIPLFSAFDNDVSACSFNDNSACFTYRPSSPAFSPSSPPQYKGGTSLFGTTRGGVECFTNRQNEGRGGVKSTSAGRVSVGPSTGQKHKAFNGHKERDHTESITITVITYYATKGTVITEEDVKHAVDDLIRLYHSVDSGKIANASFMKNNKN